MNGRNSGQVIIEFQTPMKKVTLALFSLFFLSSSAIGQDLINGDLEGPINGWSTLPPSWTAISWTDPNSLADSGGATPDLLDPDEPGDTSNGIFATPYSGATCAGGTLGGEANSTFFHEGIQQNVTGLSIGETYNVTFYQAVVRSNFCSDTSGSWMLVLDNTVIGISGATVTQQTVNSINTEWEMRSLSFTATGTSHDLKFLPADDDDNQVAIPGDEGGCLYMGLDAISINSCELLSGTHSISACDSYTWIDGLTYTSSNSTATFNLENAEGCDSLLTLNLDLSFSTEGTDVQEACDNFTWIDGNTYSSSNSTAQYILINSAGCDSVVTLDLVINTVNTSVTQDGSLLTSDEGGAEYQWVECPAMAWIDGETSQSYNAAVDGVFAVIVTNDNCTDTTACFDVTITGIIESSFGKNLLVYPNPTQGNFTIDLGENHNELTIALTDLQGRLIRSDIFENQRLLNFRLEEPAGIYLMTLESGGEKAIVRLIRR